MELSSFVEFTRLKNDHDPRHERHRDIILGRRVCGALQDEGSRPESPVTEHRQRFLNLRAVQPRDWNA